MKTVSELMKATKERSSITNGGRPCFYQSLKKRAQEYLDEVMRQKELGAKFTYASVYKTLNEDLLVNVKQNPINHHLKGECKCPKRNPA